MLQIFLQLKFHILIDIILYIKQTNKQKIHLIKYPIKQYYIYLTKMFYIKNNIYMTQIFNNIHNSQLTISNGKCLISFLTKNI